MLRFSSSSITLPSLNKEVKSFWLWKSDESGEKKPLLTEDVSSTWKCDGDMGGVLTVDSGSVEKSLVFRSFCPLMLRRAGLMRGRRCLAEPELDVTDPATEGVGEGPGDDGRLPDMREK